ncbi:MAG: gamma-glutamyl-gamma-aminobutyrate hydrolase family protein [Armatimonadetes bacterium]|nr:gamma-glutamyl-gamma-aminobutyrate hydrolase family protein [Armatimonadota bacterium]
MGGLWRTLQLAVEDAGGEGVWLGAAMFPEVESGRFDEALERIDGLLLTGGYDLSPVEGIYVDVPPSPDPEDPRLKEKFRLDTEPERDAYELPLARRALDLDMPVFGICRGFQLLNVAAGGRLIADLKTDIRHRAFSDLVSSSHPIAPAVGSQMAEIYGEKDVPINSRHHQGATPDLLAPGLEATALAPDGIVEAMEDPKRPWRFAVQWHPERPEEAALYERDRALFRAFIEQTRKR